jgi:glucan phosphorylase
MPATMTTRGPRAAADCREDEIANPTFLSHIPHEELEALFVGYGYTPHWHYDHEPETRAALDLIASGHFSGDQNLFRPIWDTLLTSGDHYVHLADLTDYVRTQERVSARYAGPDAWARKAILNDEVEQIESDVEKIERVEKEMRRDSLM